MSAQPIRRIKERGGGGGKITALVPAIKTLTPICDKSNLISDGRKSFGKENPNPNPKPASRVFGLAQRPVIRPVPRVSSGAETRSRSQPKGRSPSPCEFTKVLSDMRRNNKVCSNAEVSIGRGVSGVRGSERKKVVEKAGRVSSDSRECGSVGEKLKCVSKFYDKNVSGKDDAFDVDAKASGIVGEKLKGENKFYDKKVSSECKKVGVLDSSLRKSNEKVNDVNCSFDKCAENSSKVGKFSVVDEIGIGKGELLDGNDDLKSNCDSNLERRGLELIGKGSAVKRGSNADEGKSGRVASKSASKLQERLAFLEGKVKRIASDIKKTKDMLDMNNTNASKAIISDIQEKISGIEKAVSSVIADSGTRVSSDCSSDLAKSKSNGNDILQIAAECEEVHSQNAQVHAAKVTVKGMSSQELEARLFPHHKLLRNRNSARMSASGSQGEGNRIPESINGSDYTDGSISPIENNPIARMFLDSLNNVQSEVINAKDAQFIQNAGDVQETEEPGTSTSQQSSVSLKGKESAELDLQSNERLDEFDEQENKSAMIVEEEIEEETVPQLIEIGRKTSTGGWFVSEGESVLLAHDDGSCSFHDIANNEEKAEYRLPTTISQNIWRDCWIIRAASADGCSGKYVVAASAGNTMDSGFCSWDFYNKDVKAFHIEDNKTKTRVALGRLPDNIVHTRSTPCSVLSSENRQWWYRPCGPLIIATATGQRAMKVFDIRDGEQIMKWDVQKPVLAMDYCSSLQWRNRGKVVVAESEAISLWDVSSLSPQALLSISTSGRRISALHVNNTDAEIGGGVRQRVSSLEAEGNDGVFCTADGISILDFRQPSGIGLKIPKIGVSFESVFTRGDSIFLGCSSVISATKKQVHSQVLQFSLRKQKIVNTYTLPESNAHSHHRALTQVWGNSDLVMAVSGLGLFVFDTLKDNGLPSFVSDYSSPQNVREVIGPDDLYSPSFDYHSSQILLISRDRPALWRQLS